MITCEACKKELKALKHTHFKYNCTGEIKTLAQYKLKYPHAPTVSEATRKQLAHSEASFIAKYGEKCGQQRWIDYRQKLANKNSFAAFNERHGWTYDQWRQYNKNRAVTLENMIKRHGQMKGEELWEKYCERQRKAGNTLEYFIEKLGDREGPIKYTEVCKAKGITLENMIRLHGHEEGIARYSYWIEKTKGNYISMSGSQFVKDIVEKLDPDTIFHEGVYSKEFCVWDQRPYLFDFVVTHPVKKVVEFNGDFWHANPAKYDANELVPLRGGAKLASEIWAADARKLAAIERLGYDVLVIWESEYLADPSNVIKKVLAWLR